MSVFDPFKKLFSPPQQKGVSSGIFSFITPTSSPRTMNERAYLDSYKGWVFACTNAIAKRMAAMELKLQTRVKGEWVDVDDEHPALDLIHKVNDFTSFYDLWFATQAYLELVGNCFWNIIYNSKNEPIEIWLVDPTRMQIVKSKKNFISGYVFTNAEGQNIPFETNEIIHFKNFNALDAYRGIGTVQAAALPIDIDTHAAEWQRNFFGNSALPSGILSTEGKLEQEQFDRIKMNWDSKFKGVQNAHKVAVLEAGIKFQPMSPTSREMQFSEGRKDVRDEILGIFGVPKPILGIYEDINLASAQVSEYNFAKDTIRPKMVKNVSTLNEFYLPLVKLDSRKFRFWFTDPVPEDIKQKLDIIANGRQYGWLTPNEARSVFDYQPREGGDEITTPTVITPIPGSDQPDDPDHTEQNREEEENQEDEEKSVKKNGESKIKKEARKIELTDEQKKKAEDYKQEQIKKLHQTYLDLNSDLEKRLLKRLKQHKSIKPDEEKDILDLIVPLYRKDNQDFMQNELVEFVFANYQDWIGLVYNATKEGITEILEEGGKDVFAQLELEGSFDLENPRAVSWLEDHAMEDSVGYADNIKQEIAARVTEGVSQGLTNEEIADSISEFFDGQSDWRAMRIARSESINAYSQGTLQGYYQSNVVSMKEWFPDNEACTICKENADAGAIPLDDNFPSGDQCPIAHCNCECTIIGHVDKEA